MKNESKLDFLKRDSHPHQSEEHQSLVRFRIKSLILRYRTDTYQYSLQIFNACKLTMCSLTSTIIQIQIFLAFCEWEPGTGTGTKPKNRLFW